MSVRHPNSKFKIPERQHPDVNCEMVKMDQNSFHLGTSGCRSGAYRIDAYRNGGLTIGGPCCVPAGGAAGSVGAENGAEEGGAVPGNAVPGNMVLGARVGGEYGVGDGVKVGAAIPGTPVPGTPVLGPAG